MSEPVAKERPSVDLDDFERRLGQNDRHHEDPLAELARLVSEHHDPYGEVFAQEAVAHQPHVYQAAGRQEPAFGATAGAGMSPRLSGDFAAIEAGLRGALSAHPDADLQGAPVQHEFYAQHEHYNEHDQTYLQDHEDQQWTEAPQERAVHQPPLRSRRPIYAMAATIAVGVIGIGVAFAYKGSSSSPSEIRTIAAASGPTKIQPPADASSDQTNQDAGVLGKNGQPAPTQLVSREEQPVDISQAVQQNASRNPDAGPTQGDASNVPVPASPTPGGSTNAAGTDQGPAFGMSDMPPPKKVKVVSVRPDGTILSSDAPPVASMSIPRLAAADPSGGAEPVAKAATPKTATPKAGKPKTTSRVTAKPAQIAKSDDDGDTPAPAKPARKAKPQRVASAEPPTTDDATPAATEKPAGAGGFAVQLAAPGSESEARSASSRLAKKFASALDGRHLAFHKAQSNGKSVFRVRVSSLSKEDAVSLCDKLKADGGSCFIAKNN